MRWDDIIRVGDTESDHRCPCLHPFLSSKWGKRANFFFKRGGRGGGRILVGDFFLLVATLMSEREGGGAATRVLRERGVFWVW